MTPPADVPSREAVAAELTPLNRDLFWQYLERSDEAQVAHLWLMAATTPAAAMLRAEVAARTERRALLMFNELRSSIIRSRRGGFDPMAVVTPHDYTSPKRVSLCDVCGQGAQAEIHHVPTDDV